MKIKTAHLHPVRALQEQMFDAAWSSVIGQRALGYAESLAGRGERFGRQNQVIEALTTAFQEKAELENDSDARTFYLAVTDDFIGQSESLRPFYESSAADREICGAPADIIRTVGGRAAAKAVELRRDRLEHANRNAMGAIRPIRG